MDRLHHDRDDRRRDAGEERGDQVGAAEPDVDRGQRQQGDHRLVAQQHAGVLRGEEDVGARGVDGEEEHHEEHDEFFVFLSLRALRVFVVIPDPSCSDVD